MTERGLVEVVGAWAAEVDPPPEVRASVRQRILDIMGLCLAAHPLDTSAPVLGLVAAQGGAPQARAIGLAEPVPAAQAAFVNGVLAHSLDYDDTHLPSVLHPSASVIPAALAAAERVGATGPDLVRAVAVGLEVCVRLGMVGYDRDRRQSTYFEHGQHATSICGAIGGAAAAALLVAPAAATAGASVEATVAHAVGIAVSMASGVIEANRTGGTVKRLHCGWAAHAAVTAAELAAAGITGAPTALEGRFGFGQAFLRGEVRWDEVTDGLGERWEVPRIAFKPYPANHFTHAGIDAALALRARGVGPDDIRRLHLGVAAATVRTIGDPIAVKRAPETGYQAQFSGPYTVAAALLGGGGLGLGLDDFTDALARDPQRRALMARVEVVADDRCDAIYPDHFPAVLTAELADGSTVVEQVLTNRGTAARPLSGDELTAKFRDNAARAVAADHIAEIERAVADLDRPGSLAASVLQPTVHLKPEIPRSPWPATTPSSPAAR
jgi:2-methylcitrate dehydratase PrpD